MCARATLPVLLVYTVFIVLTLFVDLLLYNNALNIDMKIIGTYKDFKVREVDGKAVRDELATEFSEWGSHLTYKFIPKNELWIEKQDHFEADDRKPLIAAAYTEHNALKHGKSKNEAYDDALNAEEQIRKRQKHLEFPIKVKKLTTIGNLNLWLVNGELVRDNLDADFAEGGHGMVYPYIPKNEIWLDDAVMNDLENIFVHEVTEYNLMSDGMKYEDAHNIANKTEHDARKSAANKQKILKEQIAKLLKI